MKVGNRELMDEAPIECQRKERTTMSPSKASRCFLGQENNPEVCHVCPEQMDNKFSIYFYQGMEEERQWKKEHMRDKSPLLCRIFTRISSSPSRVFDGCGIGCGRVWNKDCQFCPEWVGNRKEDDASGEVQEVHLDGGEC